MLKRVRFARSAALAVFLTVVLGIGGLSAPVAAREDISAGQAGDPTDGEGVTETGGSSVDADTPTGNGQRMIKVPGLAPREIVIVVNGAVYRLDIRFLFVKWKPQ